MKRYLVIFMIAIVSIFIGVGIYMYVDYIIHNDDNPTIVNEGKDKTKEEYAYKEDLLLLGYTIDEIKTIESKVSLSDAKKYLLTKKYDNLANYLASPYFKTSNIERYENYHQNNSDYSFDNVVLYVEIGLDKEFYTEITEITNYYDIDCIVNKYYKLPSNFVPDDLVEIDTKYRGSNYKYQLRKVAADAFYEMADAALEDGIKLLIVSGYRTETTQASLFNNSVKNDGLDHALIYSAKPGHSEHQLGLALDINMASSKAHFEKTKEYAWLKENAYKYGFIERYPQGKEFITGYGFEPWHYRYLGVDLATRVYLDGSTYEEYLVKYSK